MKISQEQTQLLFKSLQPGDVFKYENQFYMRTKSYVAVMSYVHNAVRLFDGNSDWSFSDGTIVKRISGEFVIKDS